MEQLLRPLCELTVGEAALAHVWAHGGDVWEADGNRAIPRDVPDDPMAKAMRQVMAVFAELEAAMARKQLRGGRRAAIDKRGWAGGPTPYGYTHEDKVLVPVDTEQRALREARRQRRQGKSWREVTAFMNRKADGTLIYQPRRGAQWYPMTVKRIIEREEAKS